MPPPCPGLLRLLQGALLLTSPASCHHAHPHQQEQPQADCRSPNCLQETRAVFRRYDPDFQAGSLDEAYMDVTDYCQQHGVSGLLHCVTRLSSPPHPSPNLYATLHCNTTC